MLRRGVCPGGNAGVTISSPFALGVQGVTGHALLYLLERPAGMSPFGRDAQPMMGFSNRRPESNAARICFGSKASGSLPMLRRRESPPFEVVAENLGAEIETRHRRQHGLVHHHAHGRGATSPGPAQARAGLRLPLSTRNMFPGRMAEPGRGPAQSRNDDIRTAPRRRTDDRRFPPAERRWGTTQRRATPDDKARDCRLSRSATCSTPRSGRNRCWSCPRTQNRSVAVRRQPRASRSPR